MKWRVIGNNFSGLWHDEDKHSIMAHVSENGNGYDNWPFLGIFDGHKPITINIICKNTNTKREVYDWLFQRYNVKLGITYLIRNIGGKEYMHTQNTKQDGTR